MPSRTSPRARRIERFGVALVLLFALLGRVRDVGRGFDREAGGWQGAFFALAAVNYERFGLWAFGGYPSLLLDSSQALTPTVEDAAHATAPLDPPLDSPLDPARDAARANELERGVGDRADDAARVDDERVAEARAKLVYANHPPTVAWIAWLAARVGADEGWSQAWRAARAPSGIEAPLLATFLAFHMLMLAAFWWALRTAVGARAAFLALCALAVTPVALFYATLVNYENPSLACVCVGLGFWARHVRDGERRALVWSGVSFAAAGCITWAPLFFVPGLVLDAWWRRNARQARTALFVCGGATLVPLVVHAVWARACGAAGESAFARAQVLLSPLFDGSSPPWQWLFEQARQARLSFGIPLVLAAAIGIVVAARRARASDRRFAVALPLVLAAGGVLYSLAFYRHTLEEQRVFQLMWAPGVAALAGVALSRFSGKWIALALLTLAASGAWCTSELQRAARSPGEHDRPRGDGPDLPLPRTSGAQLAAALPAGSLGLVPRELGLNLAPAFYAWRNVLGVGDVAELAALRAHLPAARALPAYALVPLDPPRAAREACERFVAALPADARALGEQAGWRVWALR